MVALVTCTLFFCPQVTQAASGPVVSANAKLEREKLATEVEKLHDEDVKLDDERGLIGDLVRLAPFITALVALGGLFITLSKQMAEGRRQRELDREERIAARTQRFDEQFQLMAKNLASEQGAERAAAAASIEVFMRPEYGEFHQRVFLLLLGVLRFPRKDFSDKLLVQAFQTAAREQIPALRGENPSVDLDLSSCELTRVKLKGLDLSDADIAFANLHGAELSTSSLRRVRGYRVDLSDAHLNECDLQEARLVEANAVKARFTKANLISAKLMNADVTGASFMGAEMQEAKLDDATALGARFDGANLNNAFFRGTLLDPKALESIALRSFNWRKANWDGVTRETLERLSDGAD